METKRDKAIAELRRLLRAGRKFFVEMEDIRATECHLDCVNCKESDAASKFRGALDRAALALKVAVVLTISVTSPAWSWQFIGNPDRFPSIGLHVNNGKMDGDRLETVINSAGMELPYRNSDETQYDFRGGVDLRLPANDHLTFTVSYDHVESEYYFTRHNELGGDLYKEHRNLKGYSYGVGLRLYLNK